jgi:hypothetical protein
MTLELSCVISGSFSKAKAEIDRARECFEDYDIKVLSPDRGGLFYPEPGLIWSVGAYPLLSERNISEVAAKHRHLQSIARANFLYVCAPKGIVGISVAMEMGFAAGKNKPIYSNQLIDSMLFDDTPWGPGMLEMVEVKSPEEVAQLWKGAHLPVRGLWLPRGYVLQNI